MAKNYRKDEYVSINMNMLVLCQNEKKRKVIAKLPVSICRLCKLLLTLNEHCVSATVTGGISLTERPQKKA